MSKNYHHMHETLYRGYEAMKAYLSSAPLPDELKSNVEAIKSFALLEKPDFSDKVAKIQENYLEAKALLTTVHNNLEKYITKYSKEVISPEMSPVMVADKMIERYKLDLNMALTGLSHKTAAEYLEENVSGWDDAKIDAISALAGKAYQSVDVLWGFRDAIDACSKETEQRTEKVVLLLESFYDSAPICGSYTKETHEKNFEAAVNCSMYSLQDTAKLLGDIYSGYITDESSDS